MNEIKEGMSKSEIEDFLKNKGDFVQVDYLIRYLRTNNSMHSEDVLFI